MSNVPQTMHYKHKISSKYVSTKTLLHLRNPEKIFFTWAFYSLQRHSCKHYSGAHAIKYILFSYTERQISFTGFPLLPFPVEIWLILFDIIYNWLLIAALNGNCVDSDANCELYMQSDIFVCSGGYRDYMKNNCPKTCKYCRESFFELVKQTLLSLSEFIILCSAPCIQFYDTLYE